MAEILTESFCERCGSRYTFESAVPRARLRGVRVLSRGLKNFVLDDKTSIDEAMAAARDDTDRSLTSHQLEAFHKTFNFCMQCRQYICPTCWNDADGCCLTCAPMLGHEILPAPFPRLDTSAGIAPPDENGLAAAAMNGRKHVADGPNGLDPLARVDALAPLAAPATPPEMVGTSEVEARAAATPENMAPTSDELADAAFAAAEAAVAADAIGVDAPVGPFGEPHAHALESEAPGPARDADVPEAIVEAEAVSASEVTLDEPDVVEESAFAPEPEPEVVAEPWAVTPEDVVAPPEAESVGEIVTASGDVEDTTDRAAATAAARHADVVLAGLQPGQSLDDALAAFESEPTVAAELEAVEPPAELEIPEAAAAESPVGAEVLDVTAVAADEVTFAAVAESADTMWAASEPLGENDEPVVTEAAPPETASFVEPLDEIPSGEAVGSEPMIETPAEPESAWPAEPRLDEVTAAAIAPAVIEPIAVEPMIVEAAPEPAAPPVPEPYEIAAAAAAVDIVAQPTWSIVAPSSAPVDEMPGPSTDPAIEPPAAPPSQAVPDEEPSWPAAPQWPSPLPSSGLPFLGRPVVPTGGVNALWAESDRAVSAPSVGTDKRASGVQPCVSCGLSLSASARFCRRCGTSQVG